MYTPISNRHSYGNFLALMGTALVLMGCGGGILSNLGGGASVSRAAAPKMVRVAGGTVQVTGPSGYCVDTAETKDTAQSAFVVLARCDALAAGSSRPSTPGLLTVAVTRRANNNAALPEASQLAAFAATLEGRAALSSTGRAVDLEVLETSIADGFFAMRGHDHSPPSSSFGSEHWRALFDVSGHVVSARVNSFSGQPMSAQSGFGTLNALARGIKADNAVSNVETKTVVAETETKSDVRRPGIFARIFR